MAPTAVMRNVFIYAGNLQYHYYIGIRMMETNRTFSVTGINALPKHGMEEKPEVLI